MPTTRESVLKSWLITLLAGAVAAMGIWLAGGEPAMVSSGFAIVAIARDAGSSRGCARRLLGAAR